MKEKRNNSGGGNLAEELRLQRLRVDEKLRSLPLRIDPALNEEISKEAWRDYIAEITSPAFVDSPEGPIGMARGLSSSFMHEKLH